jgi:hypothetical protein
MYLSQVLGQRGTQVFVDRSRDTLDPTTTSQTTEQTS